MPNAKVLKTISSTYQHGFVEWPQYHHAYNLANLFLVVHEENHKVVPENTITSFKTTDINST